MSAPSLLRSVVVAVLLAFAGPAAAAPAVAPAGFDEARLSFETQLTVAQRLDVQVLLIAAGYLTAVPIEGFSLRTFAALQRAQADHGIVPTGIVTSELLERLHQAADPMLGLWGFEKVRHPSRPASIWVPLGLDLNASRYNDGIIYVDRGERFFLGFLANIGKIEQSYAYEVANARSNGSKIHYKVYKDSWYVISSTSPDGIDHYQRFHQDGPYITGILLSWNNAKGNVSAERIAVLTSASLWARMTGAPFVDPPPRQPQIASRPSPAPALPPAPVPKPADQVQRGTGFFIADDGSFITNAHVIEGCSTIRVRTDDGAVEDGHLLAKDAANDLALLQVRPAKPAGVAPLRTAVRLGEGVAAFGFPHADILSTSGNFTLGNVTALSGLADDVRFMQVSAPVQAGNSGGPLLDQSGNVVGVVTAKLNALEVAAASGDLPQNVNFALKASILGAFLDANRVAYGTGSVAPKALEPADIADRARAISAMVSCR